MGGFSSNYEGGYLDFDDSPKWINQEKTANAFAKDKRYKEKNSAENMYLNFLLSDKALLNPHQQACRSRLCQYCESDIYLRLQKNECTLNECRIEVYYQNIYIGHIQKRFQEEKIDNTKMIDTFCFKDQGLKDIQALWDGRTFYLKKKKA